MNGPRNSSMPPKYHELAKNVACIGRPTSASVRPSLVAADAQHGVARVGGVFREEEDRRRQDRARGRHAQHRRHLASIRQRRQTAQIAVQDDVVDDAVAMMSISTSRNVPTGEALRSHMLNANSQSEAVRRSYRTSGRRHQERVDAHRAQVGVRQLLAATARGDPGSVPSNEYARDLRVAAALVDELEASTGPWHRIDSA